jgi:hypothetical protein
MKSAIWLLALVLVTQTAARAQQKSPSDLEAGVTGVDSQTVLRKQTDPGSKNAGETGRLS